MGCCTSKDLHKAEDNNDIKKIRRVQTMNYGTIFKNNNNSLSKEGEEETDDSGRLRRKKMKRAEEDKVTLGSKPGTDQKTYIEPVTINEFSNKIEEQSKEVEKTVTKMEAGKDEESNKRNSRRNSDMSCELNPNGVLLALGYSIQMDYNDENEHKIPIVKQLVIPYSIEKVVKQSVDEETFTIARGSSGI